MTSHPDFPCPDCEGTGHVHVGRRGGNDPDTVRVSCPMCAGYGELEADDYERVALLEVKTCRRAFHRYHGTSYAKQMHKAARHWLNEAKKARTVLLTAQHHGGAHIGSAA